VAFDPQRTLLGGLGTSPVGRFLQKLGPAGSLPIFTHTLQVELSDTFL